MTSNFLARPRRNMALLALGCAGLALLLHPIKPPETQSSMMAPANNTANSAGPVLQSMSFQGITLDMVAPARAMEQVVHDAIRIAPALEAFVTQPETWWPQLRDEAELLPSKVLKKVAVGPGDTLMQLLTEAGAEPADSHQAIQALGQKFNPRRLKIGQEITLTFERLDDGEDYRLFEMALAPSVERELNVVREDTGFRANETIREFDLSHARVAGDITDSLYNAGIEAGLNSSLLAEFIKLFSYDVDFQREIQPGDSFEVYFERHVDDHGKTVKTGRIAAASMTLSGRELRYYYYRPHDGGDADYFTPRGQSVKKALLRTPIDGARLTSGFGKRMHPILGFSLMHKGVDFGAVSGTPIQAAGEGVVEMAGWNGGYGNYVRLRHGNGYATAYAHMTRMSVKPGQRVRQGQIIGTVGSTGRSTGPHLHYEVLLQGKQVNPMNVRFPSGRKLDGAEYERFRRYVEQVEREIRGTPVMALLSGAN
ncbi:MAG: peptidoglycan DD-metalloendopeptidase family protein [Ferrovibrio sp.]|nr:peptidoglycan DD-metalloendopeptidase family protein [Ferrovibrio sp.]